MINHPDQFTYTTFAREYQVIVSKLSDDCYHWQVIRCSNSRVLQQGEATGKEARLNALQCGLDVIQVLKGF